LKDAYLHHIPKRKLFTIIRVVSLGLRAISLGLHVISFGYNIDVTAEVANG
jgi:hypothetical protein